MRTLWIVLLVAFAAVNVYAMAVSDLTALVEFVKHPGPWGAVLIADLLIALTMVLIWLWRDARNRNVSPLPYTVLTLLTGSIGPLVYLTRYWGKRAPR